MSPPFKDHRREPRHKVLLRARMRAGGVPLDVCIRDISIRGLSLQAGTPPPPGTVVEILCNGQSIVGQVRWSKDHRFGVSSGARINVTALLAGAADSIPRDAAGVPRRRKSDWEAEPRRDVARRFQGARNTSKAAEFAAFVLIGLTLSLWLTSIVYAPMANTLRIASTGLRGQSDAVGSAQNPPGNGGLAAPRPAVAF